ncbi:hypothetical protein, partial [Novosphingobium capsulatum]|uniref:hypothetical protein n=1 Tax=Novosphingobium capsulatum TaxID=13688 RepID=UPI00286D3B7C
MNSRYCQYVASKQPFRSVRHPRRNRTRAYLCRSPTKIEQFTPFPAFAARRWQSSSAFALLAQTLAAS